MCHPILDIPKAPSVQFIYAYSYAVCYCHSYTLDRIHVHLLHLCTPLMSSIIHEHCFVSFRMRFVIFDIAATLQFNVFHTHWLCCTPRLLFYRFSFCTSHMNRRLMGFYNAVDTYIITSSTDTCDCCVPYSSWTSKFEFRRTVCLCFNFYIVDDFFFSFVYTMLVTKSRRMFDYSLSGIFHHIMFNWIEFHNDRMMHISNWIKSLLVFECTVFKLHVFPFYVEKFRFLFSIFRQCFNVLQC